MHRFNIVEEHPDYVVEICQICRMRKVFKIIDGQLDNQGYMDWHQHSILPPEHPYYGHEHEISE